MESSRNSGGEQANTVSEQHGTTWEEVSQMQFDSDAAKEKARIEQKRMTAIAKIESMKLTDTELIALTAKWNDVKVNEELLAESTRKHGNPNNH